MIPGRFPTQASEKGDILFWPVIFLIWMAGLTLRLCQNDIPEGFHSRSQIEFGGENGNSQTVSLPKIH